MRAGSVELSRATDNQARRVPVEGPPSFDNGRLAFSNTAGADIRGAARGCESRCRRERREGRALATAGLREGVSGMCFRMGDAMW